MKILPYKSIITLALCLIPLLPLGAWANTTADKTKCNQLVKKEISYWDSLQKAQITRPYFIYLPKSYCQNPHKIPAIYALHGYHGTATGIALSTTRGSLNRLAEQKDLMMVYPQGMHVIDKKGEFYSSWNFLIPKYYKPRWQRNFSFNQKNGVTPVCNLPRLAYNQEFPPKQPGCKIWRGCSWTSCYSDTDYLLAVQKAVIKQWSIPKKQYLIGFSNGAMMVYRMACQYPEKFKAAVAIAGTTAKGMLCYDQNKHSKNPNLQKGNTSLLVLSGMDDPYIILSKKQEKKIRWYKQDYFYEHMKPLIKPWSKQANCQKEKTFYDSKHLDGINCTEHTDCDGKTTLAHCTWGHNSKQTIDWGHTYPGSTEDDGWCVGKTQKNIAPDYPLCPKVSPVPKKSIQATEFIYHFLTHAKIEGKKNP